MPYYAGDDEGKPWYVDGLPEAELFSYSVRVAHIPTSRIVIAPNMKWARKIAHKKWGVIRHIKRV